MSALALQARSVCAELGGREVLHDIELDLPVGRWTSVVGPNGAGKSTLLKVLARLLPYRGSVQLLGRSTAQMPRRQLAQQLAWLGQHEAGADDLLVYDVAMLGRLPHQDWITGPTAADHLAVVQALQVTQAWDWRARALGQLSAGERQRVLLARALAVQAQVLLMDEPLANLDPPHQADWLSLVRGLVASGKTVVSVLHEVSMALHADDMVILRDGRVQHHGGCKEGPTQRALERVFDHRIGVHSFFHQPVVLMKK
jgi:iron complex transport system ATP-binding protein